MAKAHNFEGANIHARPPKGLEEMVGSLPVFHNGRCFVSAWKPTPEELEKFNAGESIFMSVMCGMKPDGSPAIFPCFVGTEEDCLEVVSDTGKVWK